MHLEWIWKGSGCESRASRICMSVTNGRICGHILRVFVLSHPLWKEGADEVTSFGLTE